MQHQQATENLMRVEKAQNKENIMHKWVILCPFLHVQPQQRSGEVRIPHHRCPQKGQVPPKGDKSSFGKARTEDFCPVEGQQKITSMEVTWKICLHTDFTFFCTSSSYILYTGDMGSAGEDPSRCPWLLQVPLAAPWGSLRAARHPEGPRQPRECNACESK